MKDGKAQVTHEKCMGCGICESKCPRVALNLKKEPAKGEPLDVTVLIKEQTQTAVESLSEIISSHN
jgi:Fe-S-cluster-containing hydrogenase component 2